MKKPSPLAKAEAALKGESAKKMAEKIVEKRVAAKAVAKPIMSKELQDKAEQASMKPVFSKEVERKVPEKVMDPPPIEVPMPVMPFEEQSRAITREEAEATDYLERRKEAVFARPLDLPKPEEGQLCLVRRRGNIALTRYRSGEFYASHAGFYSDLVDKPDAWIAVPEF